MAKRQSTQIKVDSPEEPVDSTDSADNELETEAEEDDSSLDPDGPGASIGQVLPDDEDKQAYSTPLLTEEPDLTETVLNPKQNINYPSTSDCGRWMESNLLEAFVEDDGLTHIYTGGGVRIASANTLEEACYFAGLRPQPVDDGVDEP